MRRGSLTVLGGLAITSVACSPQAPTAPADPPVEWRRELEAGMAAHREGRSADAVAAFRAATDAAAAMGSDDPRRAVALNNLAIVYIDDGRYEDAREPVTAAITILRLHQSTAPMIAVFLAQALTNAGSLNLNTGDPDAAERDYREAVSLVERLPDADARTLAQGLTGLADALRQQGKLEEAAAYYRRGLPVAEHAYVPPSAALGRILNNYGQVLLLEGRFTEAIPLLERAVATSSAALGEDVLPVGIACDNLAQAQMQTGDHAGAERSFRRALAILERTVPPDHPELQACLNNYAVFLRLNNRPAEAKRLERRLTSEPPDST